jgi:hypothetical protein
MKPKEPEENRIGPVNPFALGTVFIEAAKKLGWMDEEQVERQRRYFITPKGFTEMGKLGMDLQNIANYKPMTPRPETTLSRHERPAPEPGNVEPRNIAPRYDRPMSRPKFGPPRRDRSPSHRHDNSPSRHERPRRPDHQHDRPRDRHRH